MSATVRQIEDFAIERYMARWEFTASALLGSSDPESVPMAELVAGLDDEVRALWDGLVLGYTESAGHPLLRAAIATEYSTAGASDVLVCAGAEEAMFLLGGMLGPGDGAVVVWPAYQSAFSVPRAAGADVTRVPLRAANGWRLDVAELAAAVTDRTRLIYLNYPHNPTGAVLPAADWAAVVEIARRVGAVLVGDEVYRGLEYDPADRLPPAVDSYERGVSVGVLSKAYGLPGLRIGWLATRDRELLDRLAAAKDYTTICNSAPSEILAIGALRDRQRLLDRTRSIVAANLPLVDAFLAERADLFEWVRPRAGMIGFPRLVGRLAGGGSMAFTDRVVEASGVMVTPGSVFGSDGHVRIGFGRKNLPAALERFGAYLATAYPR